MEFQTLNLTFENLNVVLIIEHFWVSIRKDLSFLPSIHKSSWVEEEVFGLVRHRVRPWQFPVQGQPFPRQPSSYLARRGRRKSERICHISQTGRMTRTCWCSRKVLRILGKPFKRENQIGGNTRNEFKLLQIISIQTWKWTLDSKFCLNIYFL